MQVLVKKVKDHGGRFLAKGDDKLWYDMHDNDARKKAVQGKEPGLTCTIIY